MKSIEELFQTRTSVRRYERKPIEPEKIEFIYRAIQNTPTSYNGQQYSVIAVSDQTVKEQLYAITQQKQIKTCALFLVFCVDFHKLHEFADATSVAIPRLQDTIDGLLVGVIDAALAMQNAVIAAEALDLGSCCIGYTRTAAPKEIASLLQLPEGVIVVCGLSIGYPAEHPSIKPKQPLSLIIHQNHYRQEDMKKELLEYNDIIKEYNAVRSGTQTANDWGTHILDYHRQALNYDLETYLEQQGFKLSNRFKKH